MINADYIHAQYRNLISHDEFVALTERPTVRMSRFQRAALWLCYVNQSRARRSCAQMIREALGLSRCGDAHCPCRYGEACPKEDHGLSA